MTRRIVMSALLVTLLVAAGAFIATRTLFAPTTVTANFTSATGVYVGDEVRHCRGESRQHSRHHSVVGSSGNRHRSQPRGENPLRCSCRHRGAEPRGRTVHPTRANVRRGAGTHARSRGHSDRTHGRAHRMGRRQGPADESRLIAGSALPWSFPRPVACTGSATSPIAACRSAG